MKHSYDVVVIGAGSAGLTAASGFQKIGRSVLLIERDHMGGECTNSGCVPSKALLHAARSGQSGEAAFAYVRSTIDRVLQEETPDIFRKRGIDVVMGEATFTSRSSVTVNDTTYTYKTAIIATGSSPRMIDIKGLDSQHTLTNQNLFNLTDAPERLLIVGGGPIGLEMAEAFARLGSRVTIIERGPELARLEDPSIRPIVQEHLRSLGVTSYTNATVEQAHDHTAQIKITTSETVHEVQYDMVLLAIGRVPNLPGGLDVAGITSDAQGVQVDSQYRTSNTSVYAIGDVSQRLKFSHSADDAARQVVKRVASRGWLRVRQPNLVPKVTYTSPEIAQVGLHWDEAVDTYGEDRLMRIEVPFADSDRAITDDATAGVIVVVAKRLSGRVLGAHLIGPRAGELIAICSLAIAHNISLYKLQSHIFAYPTYALSIKKVGDVFVARQVANLKSDVLHWVRRNAPKLLAAVLWIGGLYALSRYQASTGLSVSETSVRLFLFLSQTMWGPLLYILIYAIRPVTFFPATALTVLAGVFYGFWLGTILTLIAATLAAAVSYGVGRFFSHKGEPTRTTVGGLMETLRAHTFVGTLAARLTFLPFDLVSYAAGIIRVPFAQFIVATSIGIMLGTAMFVAIGASLNLTEFIEHGFTPDSIRLEFISLSVAIFVASLTVANWLKRQQKR